MNLVFYLLLNFLHFLHNLYSSIKQHCVRISFILKEYVVYRRASNNLSVENLDENLTAKLPKHIAILIGLEDISVVDIIKVINWCITTQVPYISFYDHKGLLQKNYPLIRKKLKQQTSSISQDTEWIDDSSKINDDTESNEVLIDKYNQDISSNLQNKVNKQTIKIQILSYLDGKNKIVSLTKQLSSYFEWNTILEKDITSQLIGENLNGVKIPEPDLAIVMGKTMCSYGFLPWHSRITEFFVLPTHYGILFNDFKRILKKYSKCQQHYGK